MILVRRPFNWVSAHREVTFTFDYDFRYEIITGSDVDGKLAILFYNDGIHSLVAGDYVYITTGNNQGYHKIQEVFGANIYIMETDYTLAQSGGELVFIEDHVITITVGYNTGQANAALVEAQPYKVIAEFKPEPNIDGQLVFNISGYLNKLFDVMNSNDTISFTGITLYPNLFAQYQVLIDGAWVFTGNVLNAAITQYELNRDYVGTNRDLNGGSLENHFLNCGTYDVMQIYGDWVVQSRVYSDGIPDQLLADFSSTDFNGTDFSTTV